MFFPSYWLLSHQSQSGKSATPDWLLSNSSFKAELKRPDESHIVLDNGLISRTFTLFPAAATIALDNLMSGQSVIRGVKPEARLVIDGNSYNAGGLSVSLTLHTLIRHG